MKVSIVLIALAAMACVEAGVIENAQAQAQAAFEHVKHFLQDIAAGVQAGNGLQAIKDHLKVHPEVSDKLDQLYQACTANNVPEYANVGKACEFISTNFAKVKATFLEYKEKAAAGAAVAYENVKGFLQDIATGIKNGNGLQAIKDHIGKHPEISDKLDQLYQACTAQNVPQYQSIGDACKFVQVNFVKVKGLFHKYTEQVKNWINHWMNGPEEGPAGRGSLKDTAATVGQSAQDAFNHVKGFLNDITEGVKNGNPVETIKEHIGKHPEMKDKVELLKKACSDPTVQGFAYVGDACRFVQNSYDKVKAIIDEYYDDVSTWYTYILNHWGKPKPKPAAAA